MKREILRFDNVSKYISGSLVLKGICLTVHAGELLGIIHLSSLGIYQLIELIYKNGDIDFGNVFFEGKLVNTYRYTSNDVNPVAIVSEKFRLCSNLSVAENLMLASTGRIPTLYNKNAAYKQASLLLDEFGLDISPSTTADLLSPCERSLVEMLCAYKRGLKLIVLSYPESFLGDNELRSLFRHIQGLLARGMSVIYVESHVEHLLNVCDRMVLMDGGRIIKIFDQYSMTVSGLSSFFPSMKNHTAAHRIHSVAARPLLCFQDLCSPNLRGFSCSIMENSCTAIIDEFGKSTRDLIGIMTQGLKPMAGNIFFDGQNYSRKVPHSILQGKVASIQPYPLKKQLFADMSYLDNLCLSFDIRRGAVLIRRYAKQSIIKEYQDIIGPNIFAKNLHQMDYRSLYTLLYYRIQLMHPKLVFIEQPFTGCDMSLRIYVQSLICMLKNEGITLVLFSMSEADVIPVSDKRFYLQEGRIFSPD